MLVLVLAPRSFSPGSLVYPSPLKSTLCGSRKYPYPTTEGIGNSRGVGGSMAQEIPEGRRGEWLDKFPEGQLHVHVRHKCSKL